MSSLQEVFTARALRVIWDNYVQSLGTAPYLGRSFFATDKRIGLELRWIKGRKGLPVALKASAFDALAPLRHPIGFADKQNEMPFFRESYMVTEKEEQDYATYENNNPELANQVLKEIVKNPMDLILGADVVPERMIWQLLAPIDGVPKIVVTVDGGETYDIDYTGDDGVEYKKKNFVEVANKWSDASTATPLTDIRAMRKAHRHNYGNEIGTLIINENTWDMLVNAEDTKKQVQGILAYQNGITLDEEDVKRYLSSNLHVEVYVYNKMYLDEAGKSHTFIPDGMVTAIEAGVSTLGTVWYGTTPEERSGSETDGSLSIVNTGVSVYTYATNHPINTHCVVSEIVLPAYENMDSVVVMKVAEQTA